MADVLQSRPEGAVQLSRYGLLSATGDDARAFLHGQLTNDVQNLAPGHARFAGWCSPKGRLLASFLVVPHDTGLLLQVSGDLAAAVAKRLGMFILRAKAKLADESTAWKQYGFWGPGTAARLEALGLPAPSGAMTCAANAAGTVIALSADRFLVFSNSGIPGFSSSTSEADWTLEEIRAGRPLITQATQDQFVPQMANLELVGGMDFKKGCYPGQEIVTRTQHRGLLKRRMYHVLADEPLQDGQSLYSDDFPDQASGTVVNAVDREGLAVLQIGSVAQSAPVRVRPGGPALEVLSLPYAL